MMVHPAPFDMLRGKIIAASMFEVHCTGKESHASAFPELGVNAADALTIAQTALGLLRQHIRSTDRIHGIVTNGGAAPNVIPAHTSAQVHHPFRNAGTARRIAAQGVPLL
jgi:metal-dependent amidase/aminoacylase/carboxypeptidase family protein